MIRLYASLNAVPPPTQHILRWNALNRSRETSASRRLISSSHALLNSGVVVSSSSSKLANNCRANRARLEAGKPSSSIASFPSGLASPLLLLGHGSSYQLLYHPAATPATWGVLRPCPQPHFCPVGTGDNSPAVYCRDVECTFFPQVP